MERVDVAKYLEVPAEWLARFPASTRETILMLNTASRARELEKTFQVYVELAKRKANLEGAWRDVICVKDLSLNASIPFVSDLLRSSAEGRLKILEDISETVFKLNQISEELSTFSNVNRACAERLKRKAASAEDVAIQKHLEEEYSGRHVLAECEREIAKRIKDLASTKSATGGAEACSDAGARSSKDSSSKQKYLSLFIRDVESQMEVGGGCHIGSEQLATPGENYEEAEIPDSQERGELEPTLTIRGGIPTSKKGKRKRVSETPSQLCEEGISGGTLSGRENTGKKTQRHSPRLTNAVKDLEIDPTVATVQLASHSSDDSRKTPSFTPNQTAAPRSMNSTEQHGSLDLKLSPPEQAKLSKKFSAASKQSRSPWATPGVSRRPYKDKGSPQGDSTNAGKEKDEVGCALSFDDEPPKGIDSSLSDSQNDSLKPTENLKLGVTPSPPLTAST